MSLLSIFDPNRKTLRRLRSVVAQINALEAGISRLTDEEFPRRIAHLSWRARRGEVELDELLPECFALTREAARRTLNERHFDVQLMGGIALHEGKIAEMKTGEGKTLAATLPLVLNALEGKGAHLVTTNDYLVRWQADWMGHVYRFLGLTVGHIQHDMGPAERQAMYACDITYVTNSELGFDYLRDNMAVDPAHLVLRELHYAIVDEVDSILIDEARTPLIIAGAAEGTEQSLEEIDDAVRSLVRSTNERAVRARQEETYDGDYFADEKHHQVALTEQGQQKIERLLGIDNLSDPAHLDLAHRVNAALKAHVLYRRDEQYVIKDGQVVIVDEFTGHLQPGRRYTDGIHQALEAKERVHVAMESQTLATITYQNLFRLYNKLAGMTGTAKTEEAEFVSIYGMPVVVVPTNLPVIRRDHPDVVLKTAEAKKRRVVAEIVACHVREQPVLVGTRTVDASEALSARLSAEAVSRLALVHLCQEALLQQGQTGQARDMLQVLRQPLDELHETDLARIARALDIRADPAAPENLDRWLDLLGATTDASTDHERRELRARLQQVLAAGVPHNVLNARYHEQEGRIIAQAGRPGAVTVATNMAGRGVDIVLGGKPGDGRRFDPELQQRVIALGGLHVIGTERHESRRIDHQLRGRAGRQGDPGSSRFYVSLEDELMRLFAPERMGFLFAGWPEEEALESRFVTRSIERAQEKVEARNFGWRRDTLKYDDVMNVQRNVIYGDRRRVLEGEDVSESVLRMIMDTAEECVQAHADDDAYGLLTALMEAVPGIESELPLARLHEPDDPSLPEEAAAAAREVYYRREAALGADFMRAVERHWLLRVTDYHWQDHLQEMDHIRDSIHLRAWGQRDPFLEYQREAYDRFQTLLTNIARDVTRAVLLSEPAEEEEEREETAGTEEETDTAKEA